MKKYLSDYPHLVKEWHPSKNEKLLPKDFTYGSKKKIWWLCSKGHSFYQAIKNRTGQNQNCPNCAKHSSEQEIRILTELKYIFDDVKSRHKINGREVDVFLPSINLGIEYDGNYWHRDKENVDANKNEYLLSQKIHLIRVRELPLKSLSENDIIVRAGSVKKKDLDKIINKIALFSDDKIKKKINSYLKHTSFVNEAIFKTYRSYFPSPFPEDSLPTSHPSIANEWDYEKNYPLRPENFSFGSSNKIWWLCNKKHSYQSSISNRTRNNSGCPYCSGRRVSEENNLKKLFPLIAKEWHPSKNKDLLPHKVTYGSSKKVWWKCKNGHEYFSKVNSRTSGYGCPYCAGIKVGDDNDLLSKSPEVAKEWHPSKNGNLTPRDITNGSEKKVWWLCPRGHSHKSIVKNRTRKLHPSGCPYCSGNKTLNYDLFK